MGLDVLDAKEQLWYRADDEELITRAYQGHIRSIDLSLHMIQTSGHWQSIRENPVMGFYTCD